MTGRGRVIGRLLYHAAVNLELSVQRIVDAFHAAGAVDQLLVNTQLTAVIKTFERPKALARLLASIRRFYPQLPVIVVDDSRRPRAVPGVQMVPMPYDSGVSAGRNEGLRHVKTRYLPVYDKVPNFYIAQTDSIRRVMWNEAIKRMDHAEFFTRAKGVLTSVYNQQLRCLHVKTHFDASYLSHRNDTDHDRRVILQQYYGYSPAGEPDD